MMARSHALSASCLWLAGAPAVVAAAGHHLPAGELVASAAVCAGAALLPDIDSPESTIAYAGGPLTRWIADRVNKRYGHRREVHSLLFGVAVAAVSWALTAGLKRWPFTVRVQHWTLTSTAGRIIALLLVAGCFALTIKALGLGVPGLRAWFSRSWPAIYVFATVLTWSATVLAPGSWAWLPVALGLGCWFHSLGDWLTPEPVWLWWPLRPRRPRRPDCRYALIAKTGNRRERLLFQYGAGAVNLLLLWRALSPVVWT